MNVDDLVRKARPRGVPGWSDSREGRQVIDSVMGASVTERARPSRRSAARWSVIGTGVIGAAAAAVLVVPALTAAPSPTITPPAADGQAVEQSAPEILLAAATRAEKATDDGKYWRVKKLMVIPGIRVDGPPGGYELAERRVIETWDPRDASDKGWNGYRSLGAKPASEADERKWRAAGSPTEWNLGPADTPTQQDQILLSKPDAGQLRRNNEPVVYLGDAGGLRLSQVRELPDDPARLREWVNQHMQRETNVTPGSPDSERAAFGILSQLLLDVPAPPKVRAAALRAMADIPGVRSLGQVTDPAGRVGLGLEYSASGRSFYRQRLIIDGSSHLVLAFDEKSGKTAGSKVKQRSTMILAAEWSDAKPQIPSLP